MGNILKIYLHKQPYGEIHRDPHNRYSYISNETLKATDITSLPLSFGFLKDYPNIKHNRIEIFLENLKSENERWVQDKGREYKFDKNDTFTYFEHFGLDCAGAIQFIVPGEENKIFESNESLMPVTLEQIGEDLKNITAGKPTKYINDSQRLSISGAENKIGLTFLNNQWFISNGTIPSTHIIKFSELMHEQHLSEFISLKILSKLLPKGAVSNCRFKIIGGLPCIISERFDRHVDNEVNKITRIHQEDFCQILGKLPIHKYEKDGGPDANRIIEFIRNRSNNPDKDIEIFASMIFLNYLMLCPDGHGKNYAMLIEKDNFRLAPIYDFTSIAFNRDINLLAEGFKTIAMGIDGQKHFNSLTIANIHRFLHKNAIAPEWFCKKLKGFCEKLPDAIKLVFEEQTDMQISENFINNYITNLNTTIEKLKFQLTII